MTNIALPVAEVETEALPSESGFTPFSVMRYSELMAYEPDPNDILMLGEDDQPLIERGSVAAIVGPPGCHKSRLAFQMAVSQVAHVPWNGLKFMNEPLRWLFIGNENNMRRLQHDISKMTAPFPDKGYLDERLFFHVLNTPDDFNISLGTVAEGLRYKHLISEMMPDVIVVDPFEAMMQTGNSNDAAEVRESMLQLQRVANEVLDAKPVIILIHHARTGAENARQAVGYDKANYVKGSKSFYSICRTVFNIAPGEAEGGGKIVLSCGKSNNSRGFSTRGLVLDETTSTFNIDPSFDLQAWKDDLEGKRSQKACSIADVLGAVAAGKTKRQDIHEAVMGDTGASKATVNRRIDDALDCGRLVKVARGEFQLPPSDEMLPFSDEEVRETPF